MPFTRVGEKDGHIYVDLLNAERQVVEISPSGWQVLDESPVLFLRPPGARPLPLPKKGGSIERLRAILGITDDGNWLLICGWLFGALHVRGEHLLLALNGPPGSGKSTATRLLAQVIDPHDPQYLIMTFKSEDMQLAASTRWVLSYDEMDGVTKDKSRFLSTLATGSAIVQRRLYTNGVTYVIAARPPIIINGLESVLGEERLRDRSVPVTFTRLASECRRPTTELTTEFVSVWPEVLGALFDCAARALRHTGEACAPEDQIRMTEAGLWIERCLQAMGAQKGAFSRTLKAAQQKALEALAGEWIVLPTIEALVKEKRNFEGTATELFATLNAHRTNCRQHRDWPKSANQLSAALNTHGAALDKMGIEMTQTRTSHQRTICLRLRQSVPPAIPITPEASKELADKGRALAATLPNALICCDEPVGSYSLWGDCAEQAGKLVARSVDENGVIRLNSEEWDSVFPKLQHDGTVLI